MRLVQAELPGPARALPEGAFERRGQEHVWCDAITGTRWAMPGAAVTEHMRRARQDLPEAKPDGSTEPAFNLPWPEAGPAPWRLVDQAHVFAALYYAVSAAARAGWAQERAAARRFALEAPQSATALRDPAAARACWAALAGRTDAAFAAYRFDVVRAGAVRIQQYVLESNWLPGIRGASALLGQVEDELASCLPVPDLLLFAGGGHALAVVPSGAGEETAEAIERLYTGITITARAVAASLPADLRAVRGEGYRSLERRLEFALARRQHSLLPCTLSPAALAPLPTAGGEQGPTPGPSRPCERCLLRDARHVVAGPEREEALCASCARKREAAAREERTLRQRFAQATGRRLATVRSLEDVGDGDAERGRYVGLLYGDGNGLGGAVARLDSLPALRQFSLRLNEAAEQAVFAAVAARVPDGRAELVLLGGDDVRLFVPGRVAWAVANDVTRHFEEAFRNRSSGAPTLTMAVGAAIAHVKTPITFQGEVVAALLRSAKRRAKEPPGAPRSAVDVAVLDSFESFAEGLETFRQETFQAPAAGPPCTLTARPFTLPESEALRRLAAGLAARPAAAAHRAQLHRLAEAVQRGEPEEADLFLAYQLARTESQEWREALQAACRQHARALGAEPAGSDRPTFYAPARQGGRRTAWLDVLELLEFAAETDLGAASSGVSG